MPRKRDIPPTVPPDYQAQFDDFWKQSDRQLLLDKTEPSPEEEEYSLQDSEYLPESDPDEAEEEQSFDISTLTVVLPPRRPKGRQSAKAAAKYNDAALLFFDAMLQIDSRLDFKVSARGWCYLLEPYGLYKGDFDRAEKLINDARKSCDLPLDICAEDERRLPDNLENLDEYDPVKEAKRAVEVLDGWADNYNAISFWESQPYYVQMVVEKIDLKSLFSPVCAKYHIPCINAAGWADINSRAQMAARFRYWEKRGKPGILLYGGDLDPGGLHMSDLLRKNFAQLYRATKWDPEGLIIDRFGLNYDFIEENHLTWIDNLEASSKKRLDDPEHRDHYKKYVQSYIRQFGKRKCEANALVVQAEAGRKLCLDTICKYIDTDGIEHWEVDTEEKRDQFRAALPAEVEKWLRRQP